MEQTTLLTVLVVVFEVLGILSGVHAVTSVRTPQGTIAWAISLITFPFLAVPAYWVFGRNKFHGYVRARQRDLQPLNQVIQQVNESALRTAGAEGHPLGDKQSVERLARVPVTIGNDVKLLIDGQRTFDDIFEGIDAAERYVLVQFYIVRADELGRALQSRLIEKAKQGVRVLFLYDEIGSLGLPESYLDDMRAAGVEAHRFHSRKGRGNRFQLNFRNHRKTVVVDGHTAWIGGHNVGDEYLGKDPEVGAWRDTHARIRGPAVLGAQLAFAEDWRWATDVLPAFLDWDVPSPTPTGMPAIVVATGPADEWETAAFLFTRAINVATRRVWIASPYFVPDEGTLRALQLAALRGVDVRVLIPEKADSLLVTLAAYSFFNEVNSTGGNIYRYQEGFLHGKYALVDDDVCAVGTANFDNRSFRLNFEITLIAVDSSFGDEMEQMFEEDFRRSRLMEPGEVEAKSALFRFGVRVARLAAPVL
jgi:cardiolipin synthase